MLHTAFEAAIDDGLIDKNPVPRARRCEKRQPKINSLHPDERDVLLAATHIPDYALIATALRTGKREGELLALQWKSVDLNHDTGVIHVIRSYEPRERVFKEVKGHQRRAVDLFPHTVRVLRKLQERTHGHGDDLVFCHADGSVLCPGTVTHTWARTLRTLGLRHVRFHDLRHTHATELLSELGWPIKAVQERLGHETAKMTLDDYADFIPGLQARLVHDMEKPRTCRETAGEDGASEGIRTPDPRFTNSTMKIPPHDPL
jgi:integrase